MKINISSYNLFLCAFAPFVVGAIIHDYAHSELVTWIATIILLVFSFNYLYNSLDFDVRAKKAFLYFSIFSLILSLLGSYIAINLEVFASYQDVKAFKIPLNPIGDLNGIAPVCEKFKNIAEESSLLDAIKYPWLDGYFNNLLSPYKFGFALWSMPGIGFYSLTILSWWFCVIFYSLALHIYSLSTDSTNRQYYYANFIAWIIMPFALHFDREAIVVVLIGIVSFGIITLSRLSFKDLIALIISVYLISIHRTVYVPLVIFMVIIFMSYRFMYLSNILVKNISRKKVFFYFICLLFLSSVVNNVAAGINNFIEIDEKAFTQFNQLKDMDQDLWQKFRFNIPIVDDLTKLLFLSLSPFPYQQIFRSGDNWSLIVPERLISLSIFPVFVVGKLYLIVLVVRKIIAGITYRPELLLLSMLFVLPVLSSVRVGTYYLLPSLSVLVYWILLNDFNSVFNNKSRDILIKVIFITHFIYIIVYQKI